MSIYATIPGLGGDGDDPAVGPPWQYLGSHILPTEEDSRRGAISLALIPSHITRDGRDDQPEDGTPWPWIRLHLADVGDDPAVILNPAQARHLAQQLTDWADWITGAVLTARDTEMQQLRTRAEQAETILRVLVNATDVTHRYMLTGGHDRLGPGYTCSGCAIAERARKHLAQGGPATGTGA